jgi:hypothetical protein
MDGTAPDTRTELGSHDVTDPLSMHGMEFDSSSIPFQVVDLL